MAKSYFKVHERGTDNTTGRHTTARADYVFFDDEDHMDTWLAHKRASERGTRHGVVLSVYRTPAVFGPWSGVPVIAGAP